MVSIPFVANIVQFLNYSNLKVQNMEKTSIRYSGFKNTEANFNNINNKYNQFNASFLLSFE